MLQSWGGQGTANLSLCELFGTTFLRLLVNPAAHGMTNANFEA